MRGRVSALLRVLLVVQFAWLAGFRPAHAEARAKAFTVGSKRFAESMILGEIVRLEAERAAEAEARHARGLGTTGIVLAALETGAVDLYVEYTGTLRREILKTEGPLHASGASGVGDAAGIAALDRELAPRGLGVGVPLGFEDTYALAAVGPVAARLSLATLSHLSAHPALRYGVSHEFLERADGWPRVASAYGLTARPRGLEHALAYEAAAAGDVDVVDVYSTDAKVARFGLTVLRDDRHAFPDYAAVLFYRRDLPTRLPNTWAALASLRGTIDEARMRAMNARVEVDGASIEAVAADFVRSRGGEPEAAPEAELSRRTFTALLFGPDLARLAVEHVTLVLVSLLAAIALGVPLGVLAAYRPRLGQGVLGVVGVLQTIPSLALFAFLIPVFHRVGAWPTLAALFLYALLPIVRFTHAGLEEIPASLRESARALGLPFAFRLVRIELPLASRGILAGVKTAAVLNVGTATVAAFVGAGGFGERIASGLAVNDTRLLLAGAIPSAALAVAMQVAFGLADRILLPRGLRV